MVGWSLGEKTLTTWSSAASASLVRRNVVTTPLTCGFQASVTIANFIRNSEI